ncbi:CHASE domain-containing protein [Aromatoleum petrolei]|uniref:Diguanylate cyclase n=1 Tax=Aromatoleum petrolei TaxID=76116 RepID=A0ABX1MSF8_9RHOO|nr:CHASE domain-containing protein [Aromatoleum petrolei]NMF89261.1 diguanylate cyclase [Aromatoleum petrolei]QTQ35014.1 Diguanylate cyclase/phosphodiesterase, PAS domain-containing [Aromatoleum petrolei]
MHDAEVQGADTASARTWSPLGGVFIAVALACAIGAAAVVWRHLGQRHDEQLNAHLASHSAEVVLTVRERFQSYRMLLRGGQAFMRSRDDFDFLAWRTYLQRLSFQEEFPGVQGIGFAQWIQPGQLEAHLRAMREFAGDDYRVWPEGQRALLSSIVVLEPADWRNARAIGYDMYSEPIRREAMDRAVQSGDAALSGKTILVQETESDVQAGVLLYMPLFADGMPIASEAERWAALRGWVYMPFRMTSLMRQMLDQHPGQIRLQVFDRATAAESLLYDSHAGMPESASRPVSAEHVSLGGTEWIIRLHALSSFDAEPDIRQAEFVSVVLVGVLLVVTALFFAVTRERATRLARTTESLRRSEAKYSTLVNLAHDGIAATDAEFRLTFVNPGFIELVGREESSLIGRTLDELWVDGGGESREAMLARLGEGKSRHYEVRLKRGDGRQLTVLASLAPLKDGWGQTKGAIALLSDITERKDAERRIAHMATHDILTGAVNRLMFGELLGYALVQARRSGHRFALLFIDLDHFKRVNDDFGHHVGDMLLCEAVRRMQGSIRSSDALGRRGGDEFVVLLPEIVGDTDAEIVAEKIRSALEKPFMFEGREVRISSSIGIALYPEDGKDEHELMCRADEAMYRAKLGGRNRACRVR